MRKLTIIREKTFVASAGKMEIYLLSNDGDVEINGRKFILLDKIKNGKEFHTEISDEKGYLHMCYFGSKNFNPATYNIQAGNQNITIYLKAKFGPFSGNPITITKVMEH